MVSSIHLSEVRERKYPLMIQVLLVLLIIKLIFKPYEDIELYYFFVGILAASLTALFLVLFKFKVSLHQMAVAGVTIFLIGVSIHFNINMLASISILCITNGLVASSRLHTKSHSAARIVLWVFYWRHYRSFYCLVFGSKTSPTRLSLEKEKQKP